MQGASDGNGEIEGLDTQAMSTWLEGLGIGVEPPVTFARVGLGQSNLTYLATDAKGERLVLRRAPEHVA